MTSIVSVWRKRATKMASPTEASAAAIAISRETDHEETSGHEQDVGERNSGDHDVFSRRARTKAPTRAASSSTERASNGRR